LTENMRSDQLLFDYFTGIWDMTLEQALTKGRNDFPCTEKPANFTLVISHDQRRKINRERNLQQRPNNAIFLRAPKVSISGNAPQNMFIWKGLRLIGVGGKLLKGVFYTVGSCDNESVSLTTGEQLSHEEAVRCLRLSYAITYASSQGLSLPGVVRLESTSCKHFGLRHLYVGASRCTSYLLLEIT